MYFRIFFVLNRVGVSNPQRITYTQILVEYFPLPPPTRAPRVHSTLAELALAALAELLRHFAVLRKGIQGSVGFWIPGTVSQS